MTVATVQEGGLGYDTHYRFQYVSQEKLAQSGWAAAESTPEVDLGSGDLAEYVGADLPALAPGETYRFRIVATNTSPGDPVVDGEEQSLTVPASPTVAPEGSTACPNEALRTGPSAHLPDCRAYEQLTPVEKGGAQEIYNYGGNVGDEGAIPGEDGNHLLFNSTFVKWGGGADAGQAPYFFSRTEAGWQMTAGEPQPETGVDLYHPQIFTPDLTQFGFEARWQTTEAIRSPDIEFRAGPPGGPYATVATVTRKQADGGGWVAASEDFSKLLLALPDHTLLGSSTHTKEGMDLYEYSAGQLRQVNVTGPAPGATVGACGAVMPQGGNDGTISGNTAMGRRAVSADGSRVFFEAVPGANCLEAKHLYMRVDGGGENAETVDIGVYRFLAANRDASEVLLEKPGGENPGLYLYKVGSTSPEFLPSSGFVSRELAAQGSALISEDLSTVYLLQNEDSSLQRSGLYRYDVSAGKLLFVAALGHRAEGAATIRSSSPDGRYLYFEAGSVEGLASGGGRILETPHAREGGEQSAQVYRYDSAEAVVQCVSCASSFDPEPRENTHFVEGGGTGGVDFSPQGMPTSAIASANGDYAFFDTPAALVPSDVDGEVDTRNGHGEHGVSSNPFPATSMSGAATASTAVPSSRVVSR